MKKHSKKRSVVCRVAAFLLMLMMLTTVIGGTVSAESFQKVPYDTYTYWTAPGTRWTASSTPMYEFETTITAASLGITDFKEPNDIFTDTKGLIYIMDSGNGRVVVVNPDYTLHSVIDSLTFNDQALTFVGAKGIFVTEDQTIYIADTENARVIVTGLDKTVKKVLLLPDADVIPENFSYRPNKIAVDTKGYVYILSEGSYYGAVLYKPDGSFNGFYGSNSVEGSILGVFEKIYEKIFVSDMKKANAEQELPYCFTDISIDDENFIYTATGAVSTQKTNAGQLKKLSPGGTNVLKDKTGSKVTSAEGVNFSDGGGVKYPMSTGYFAWRVTDLCSMDVDKDGYMYGLCRTYGHIFIYDQDCNLLSVFGGGISVGLQQGTFVKASSIHINDLTQDVLVVDTSNLNVTVYKETEYGNWVKTAQNLTNAGNYSDAKEYWNKALTYDRNLQLAYRGLARAALVEEDYELCLEYAKLGFDQDTYGSAYKYVRNDYLTNNFVWIFLIAIALVGGLIFFLVYSNKHEVKLIKNVKFATMLQSVVHPFQGAQQVRYYGNGSVKLATGCMILYFLSGVVSTMYYSFSFVAFDKSSYNVVFPFITSVGLVLLWTVANWGMSTLFEGKGTMKHVYIVTCYALIPTIISNILLTALSHVFTPEEALLLTAISTVCTALTAIMLCVGNMTVHEFGFFKFIVMTIITVLAMLVVVFCVLMIFVLVQQLTGFIGTLYKEVSYR